MQSHVFTENGNGHVGRPLHADIVFAKLVENSFVLTAKAVENVPVELLKNSVLEIKSLNTFH